MPATISYANVLHAVGEVLDQVGAKSIAIREEEDGLFIEGYDGDGQILIQAHCDIASLYDLVSRSEAQTDTQVTADAGVLRRFLADHSRELAGVTR